MKNFVNLILKCIKGLLMWLMNKTPIVDIIIITFYVLFALLFRCLKGLLQWLKEEITIIDVIIIAFYVLFILIFRRLPNIELLDLQYAIEGILMLGALIFAVFSPVAKAKRKAHKKEQEKDKENKSDNTSE